MDGLSEDRIILQYKTPEPIDLEQLTASFSGLTNQYRRALERRRIEPEEIDARLFITRIQSGSIEAEIGVAAVAFLTAFQFMDYSLIFAEFTARIKSSLDYFTGLGRRPKDLDKQDCQDIKAFIGAMKARKGGSLRYKHAKLHEKTNQREILVEFDFDSTSIDTADRSIDQEILTLERRQATSFKIYQKKRLRWLQVNRDEARTAGLRSADKAIIDEIDDKPLSVFFPPGAEILKRRMIDLAENPSKRGFIVDVHVQYTDGQPRQYTILELHTIIPFDDGATEARTLL